MSSTPRQGSSRCVQFVDLPWTDTEYLLWNVPCLPQHLTLPIPPSASPIGWSSTPSGFSAPPPHHEEPPSCLHRRTVSHMPLCPPPALAWGPSPHVVVVSLLLCLSCSLRAGTVLNPNVETPSPSLAYGECSINICGRQDYNK